METDTHSNGESLKLTKRERQVLDLASEGVVDNDIAKCLGIRSGTVRTYWARIRWKLGANTRVQLIAQRLKSESEHDAAEARQENERLIYEITVRRRAEEALQQSDERLQQLFEACCDGILIFGTSDIIDFANGAASDFLGIDHKTLIGASIRQVIPPELFTLYKKRRSLRNVEWEFPCVQGTPKHAEVTARRFTVGMHMVMLHDITTRRQAEKALSETRKWLRIVSSNAPVIIFALDKDGRITYSDGKGLQHVGRKPFESVGMSVFDLYAGIPQICQNVRKALAGEEVYEITPLGGRWLDARLYPVRNFHGEVEGVVGVSLDVTELVRTQKALESERQFVSSLLDLIDALVILVDKHGQIQYFSGGCERISGYSQDEISARSCLDLLIPEDEKAGVIEALDKVFSGESVGPRENHWITKTGELRLIEWRNTALRDESGRIQSILAVGVDRTDSRAKEHVMLRNEHMLRTILTTVPTFVFSTDIDGRFRLLEGKGIRLLGINPDDLIGQSIYERYADRSDILDGFVRAYAGEESTQRVERAGRILEVCYRPSYDEHGVQDGVIGSSLDITEWVPRVSS